MIVVYRDLAKEDLIEKMRKNVIPVHESQTTLKEYLDHGSQELMIEKLSVSLKCQFYGNRIQIPVRSRLCSTHYQPFDLLSFVNSSTFAKTSTKKWKCPICDKRAYNIVVDSYILDLMKKNKKAMEITFKNNELPEMIEQEESDMS